MQLMSLCTVLFLGCCITTAYFFFAQIRRMNLKVVSVCCVEEEEGEEEEEGQPWGAVWQGCCGGVASVPVAAAVLDEDVECARSFEARLGTFLMLAAQPAATADEAVVITNWKERKNIHSHTSTKIFLRSNLITHFTFSKSVWILFLFTHTLKNSYHAYTLFGNQGP